MGLIELVALRDNPWKKPAGCPSKYETETIYSGNDEGNLEIEIAVAQFSGAGQPIRGDLAKLHKARKGNSNNPVVVVAIKEDKSWLFGPNDDGVITGPLDLEYSKRIVQAALNEPSGLAARKRINQTYSAINGTATGPDVANALPGVSNSGLFASHELRQGVRLRPDWVKACKKSISILGERQEDLIRSLGYTPERIDSNAILLKNNGDNARAVAVLLREDETFDGESNRFAVSPVAFGIKVAEEREVSWLMVLRGSQLRIYPAKLDIGVGRKGLAETYFELDLVIADKTTSGFLSLIFSAEALSDGGTCSEILLSSKQFAVGLGERLRDAVYGSIIPDLGLEVGFQLGELGYEMDRDGLDLAYQITLRIFFRLLFQAYAEDRKLLPFGENPKYDRNALKTFAQDLNENEEHEFDPESTSLWDDLTQVWRVIDKGDKDWGVPAYNGGLFASDSELNPEGALIEQLKITNYVMGPALKALLIDTDPQDGSTGPIDFRSLGVSEFGSIYEGLLESHLSVADQAMVLDDDDNWKPARKGAKLDPDRSADKGDIYYSDTSGTRKGTGSYYTPSFIVEHLLERSLDPTLDAHLEKVAVALDEGNKSGAADLFFDFRVADIAMGSGHFLTAAIDHIEKRMAGFLDKHPIPGVTKELLALERAAITALGEDAPSPEPSSLLRRQIARRCIYGLDINPIAVELARVSIWIHTFVRGLPMSSLDHNLVCANSLTGIGSIEEAIEVLEATSKSKKKVTPGHMSIGGWAIREVLQKTRLIFVEIAAGAELDRKEAKAAQRAAKKGLEEAREAKLLFDAAVLARIGRDDLIDLGTPAQIAEQAARPDAQEALAPLAPAHMPFLFPEVFLRENGGFDVLIGNPPWEKLKVEEHRWWCLRSPGLLGLPVAQRAKATKKLMDTRPDLVKEYEHDIENNDAARRVIASGPYPGIGSGDIDLYKAFAWRNWKLLRDNGSLSVVLPRGALNGSGTQIWRREILDYGTFKDVVVTTNTGGWVFANVHGQLSPAFIVVEKNEGKSVVTFAGPFPNMAEFLQGRDNLMQVPKDEFLSWTGTASFPLIPDALAGEVFLQMRKSPALSDTKEFEFRAYRELDAANDKHLFNTNPATAKGDMPVLSGASFNLWEPDFGVPYGYGSSKTLEHILNKTKNSENKTDSVFNGMKILTAEDLPMDAPRIAFRDITNATNTRTMLCCLVPPSVALVHQAPYLVRRAGDERCEAFLLGVMSSRIFDWYCRRIVEGHMTFELLKRMPIPRPPATGLLRRRVVEISGTLAAVDKRYAKWAKAVGVPIGSVKAPAAREELEIELDALVAHLYGLTRDQVTHIYKTFHHGWDYAPRLERVLTYFDKIAKK